MLGSTAKEWVALRCAARRYAIASKWSNGASHEDKKAARERLDQAALAYAMASKEASNVSK